MDMLPFYFRGLSFAVINGWRLSRATVGEMNTAWDVEGWVWGFGEDRTIAHEFSNLVASLSLCLECALG
jgi:hypothetical protein